MTSAGDQTLTPSAAELLSQRVQELAHASEALAAQEEQLRHIDAQMREKVSALWQYFTDRWPPLAMVNEIARQFSVENQSANATTRPSTSEALPADVLADTDAGSITPPAQVYIPDDHDTYLMLENVSQPLLGVHLSTRQHWVLKSTLHALHAGMASLSGALHAMKPPEVTVDRRQWDLLVKNAGKAFCKNMVLLSQIAGADQRRIKFLSQYIEAVTAQPDLAIRGWIETYAARDGQPMPSDHEVLGNQSWQCGEEEGSAPTVSAESALSKLAVPGISQMMPQHALAADSSSTNVAEEREVRESRAMTGKRIPTRQEIESMIGRAVSLYERNQLIRGEFVGARALLSILFNVIAKSKYALKETDIQELPPHLVLRLTKRLIADPDRRTMYLEIVGEDLGVQEFMTEFWKAATDYPTMSISRWIEHNS